ncbi:MAG: hypothetical protein EU539_13710 [Promethearchaeota archaeon]|nr:MAG: hypothetical protein EU539_13710 [Candidatus Lokiarchaeota archaeon]
MSSSNVGRNAQMELIFVYNADSGLFNQAKDYFHKLLRPKTYPCQLCAVSYGNFGMKKDWKEYVDSLEIPVRFLHKDEFNEEFDMPDAKFPCAYLRNSSDLELIVPRKEMNKVKTIPELEDLVNKKLNTIS